MLHFIEGDLANKADHATLIEAMHRNRADVFGPKGHNWVVHVIGGWEVDEFDNAEPLYVISTGDTGKYHGSLRLLPTTGPNMLRDVFPELLVEKDVDGCPLIGFTIESATIWESSRICVAGVAVANILHELVLGIGEVCRRAGLTQIVSVFDPLVLRRLRGIGLKVDIIGTPQRIGGVMCYAGLFDFDNGKMEDFKKRWGLDHVEFSS